MRKVEEYLLEEQLALRVEQEDREGAVQHALVNILH